MTCNGHESYTYTSCSILYISYTRDTHTFYLKDTHKHTMWTAQLFRFAIANQLGNLTVVSFAIQMLLQHNIEIPTTYLNSDIEKNNQVVRKMSEKLGLGLKECA